MAKTKGKSSRKKGAEEEVVQCPHLHFKTDIIDRNVLSKEQHLNLLSTPKGYRWEEYKKEGGDGGPAEELAAPRRIMCSGRKMKKAEKVYVHNFLAEVWNLLTPEMVDRLKGMLMNEFGMSPQEADDFICKQREENILNSSTVSFYKKPRYIGDGKHVYDHVVKMRNPNKAHCDKLPKSNLGIRNSWIKDFSDFLSDMMSSYVLDSMCSERTERQQEIAQTLLNRFNSLLELKASMSDPKTPTDKTLVLVADRLATWLDNNVDVSKEAAQKLETIKETERRKNVEEERKIRNKEIKKQRERREAEQQAQKLADEQAQRSGEEASKQFAQDEQAQKFDNEEYAQNLAEEIVREIELEEKSPEGLGDIISGGDEEVTDGVQPAEPMEEQKEEGEALRGEVEESKKEEDEGASEDAKSQIEVEKLDEQENRGEEEEKEGEEEEDEEEAAIASAIEELKALDQVKAKEEDEKAAISEVDNKKVEDELKQAEAEEQRFQEEAAAVEVQKQKAVDEQNQEDLDASGAEKQTSEEEQEKAAAGEALHAEEELEQKDYEKVAATAAELTKRESEEEIKKPEEDGIGVAPLKVGTEKTPDEELEVVPLEPIEDISASETTESEPPVSDVEDIYVPVSLEQAELIAREEERPTDEKATPEVGGPKEDALSPEEKEQRTNEVLKSVASIILETKIDSSARQEALKDIMGKHLEESLGDQNKEAIDKVSSKIGTWIDKMVDQATMEYGERDSSRPTPGPEDIWAPANSRAQKPISAPSDLGLVPEIAKAPNVPGRVPERVLAPTGPGWVPGSIRVPNGYEVSTVSGQSGRVPVVGTGTGQPIRVPGWGPLPGEPGWVPRVSGAEQPGIPALRAPVAQRPKGSIYHLSRNDRGFDVNIISNTRAQEKIRLARGKSPAYYSVPNPDAPMEPADLKSWYRWTSALTEVAESWAEWIKDTIKGTQVMGEEVVRDNRPERMSEWREYTESRAQTARMWQQTKKDMEQRADMWSRKGRRVQSQ